MTTGCFCFQVVLVFCLVNVGTSCLDHKFIPKATVPGATQEDVTTKLLTGAYKDIGNKESCQLEPLSNKNEHTRTRRVPMVFEQPLKTIPQVIVSVTNLLAQGSKYLKYETQALDVTTKGFTLEYKVFSDASIENVEVQWMALG
eukprot:g3629.t1